MKNKFAHTSEIMEKFEFLEKDFNLRISKEDNHNYGAYVDYIGNGIKVSLGFDFKDYYFYFLIYNQEQLEYSDIQYGKSIKSIKDLVLKNNPNYEVKDLQPDYLNGYSDALEINSKLLKMFGSKILNGKEWF